MFAPLQSNLAKLFIFSHFCVFDNIFLARTKCRVYPPKHHKTSYKEEKTVIMSKMYLARSLYGKCAGCTAAVSITVWWLLQMRWALTLQKFPSHKASPRHRQQIPRGADLGGWVGLSGPPWAVPKRASAGAIFGSCFSRPGLLGAGCGGAGLGGWVNPSLSADRLKYCTLITEFVPGATVSASATTTPATPRNVTPPFHIWGRISKPLGGILYVREDQTSATKTTHACHHNFVLMLPKFRFFKAKFQLVTIF